MQPPPGSVERLRYLVTQVPAGQLTDEQWKEISTLVALHRHTDRWVRAVGRYLDQLKAGQEPMF